MSQISKNKNTNFHLIYNIDSYTNDKHSEALLNPDRWAEGYKMINGINGGSLGYNIYYEWTQKYFMVRIEVERKKINKNCQRIFFWMSKST